MWRTLLTLIHSSVRESTALRCVCVVSKYFLLFYEFVFSDTGRLLRLVDDILEIARDLALGHEELAAFAQRRLRLVVGRSWNLLLLLLQYRNLVARIHILRDRIIQVLLSVRVKFNVWILIVFYSKLIVDLFRWINHVLDGDFVLSGDGYALWHVVDFAQCICSDLLRHVTHVTWFFYTWGHHRLIHGNVQS